VKYTSVMASAPATLMLFGEHAVLKNYPAICAALDQRLSVIITPRQDQKFSFQSKLGVGVFSFDQLSEPMEPFAYLMGVLNEYPMIKKHGLDIAIHSDFSHQIGFGSSSAILIALVSALEFLLFKKTNPRRVFFTARKVLHKIQGMGSGTDLATALYGGVIFYQPYPLEIIRLPEIFLISAIYSGHKTPTREVIRKIEQQEKEDPDLYQRYFSKIGEVTKQARIAIETKQWRTLGALMNAQQMIMEAMDLNTPEINQIIQSVQKFNILGAKISGSGLGDCVITLGEIPKNSYPDNPIQEHSGILQIPVKISPQGVEVREV